METALLCLSDSAADRERLLRASARAPELILVAPPEVRERLGAVAQHARWASAKALEDLAGPTPQLSLAVAAARAIREIHRQSPLGEVRFAAADGGGWALGLLSRQGTEFDGIELVAELPDRAEFFLRPISLGDDHLAAVERAARRIALRDADQIEGSETVKSALEAAGLKLGSPRRSRRASNPTVSAVVSHYNLGAYLPDCLASLRSQTMPVEIVLVDDGSSPEHLAVVTGEAARDPAMKVIVQRNAGLVAARNAGLAAASGELVLIVDADNLMRPNLVEVLAEALARRQEASAAAPAFRAFEDGSNRTLFHYCPTELELPALFIANICGDACALHRREALLRIGGFHQSRGRTGGLEDWKLWLDYVAAGLLTAAVPEVLFDYRVRPDSMLRKRSKLEEIHGHFTIAAEHSPLLGPVADEVGLLAAARLQELLQGAHHDGRIEESRRSDETTVEVRANAEQERQRSAGLLAASEIRLAILNDQHREISARHAAEIRTRQAVESLAAEQASRIAALEERLRALSVEAAAARREQNASAAALEELQEAVAELRSSSAVRSAEMLRALSPALHGRLGRLLRLILRTERND